MAASAAFLLRRRHAGHCHPRRIRAAWPPASGAGVPGSAGPGQNWKPPTPPTRNAWAALACARAQPSFRTSALRYRTLLERLGPALDGPGTLADADAWYFILEGTREQSVAEAQALALTELVDHAATSEGHPGAPRDAAVAALPRPSRGKVPLWQLYERGRSLGIGVQVSAQSWQGLGAT